MALNLFKKKQKPQEEIKTVTIEKKDEVVLENTNQDFLKSPEGTPPPAAVDIEEAKIFIRKLKIRFQIVFYTFLFSLFLLAFGKPIIRFYKENFIKTRTTVVEEPEVTTPEEKPEIIDPESIVEYGNDRLKLTLDRLYKTSLFENTEEVDKTKKIEIIFDKNNPNKNLSVDELSEGYIFRVSVFPTILRKIDEIAQVKKEAFISSCPKAAILTETEISYINGVEGRSFEVKNCGSDFKVTYVVKNGLNYEFSQIFKGDLGFRQAYKAETENIIDSIKFYPEEVVDPGRLDTYQNDTLKFSFDFPRSLSKDCCNASGPISLGASLLISLGNSDTYVDTNNFDSITVYSDEKKNIDFYNYLENQKKLLVDDYLITRGQAPKNEIREIMVGDKKATMLRGYSWRGNDLIYIELVGERVDKYVLVISIKNLSGDSFDNTVKTILESFKFF